MSNFPLYDSLSKDIPTKDLSVKEKETLIDNIKGIDKKGQELIYALIQFHNIENNDERLCSNLPYNGNKELNKNGNSDLSWTLTKLPINLRHVLNKFVTIHTNTMKQDIERTSQI
jgi:hypothetical protein